MDPLHKHACILAQHAMFALSSPQFPSNMEELLCWGVGKGLFVCVCVKPGLRMFKPLMQT